MADRKTNSIILGFWLKMWILTKMDAARVKESLSVLKN